MRIMLHIGLEPCGTAPLQALLHDRRKALARKGVLFPTSPGGRNHTRLFMAVTDPDRDEPLRQLRGFGDPARQAALLARMGSELKAEIDKTAPGTLILSAGQLASGLRNREELQRLHDFLTPFSDDIHILAHIEDPARVLARHYAAAVFDGRTVSLARDMALLERSNWRKACLAESGAEVDAASFWLDYTGLQGAWEDVFGPGSVRFLGFDPRDFTGANLMKTAREAFDLPKNIGSFDEAFKPARPSASWVTRARRLNGVLAKLEAKGYDIPRPQRRMFLGEISVPGQPIDPGSLWPVSDRFLHANQALVAAHPGLDPHVFTPDPKALLWQEADPTMGFRATQYAAAFLPRMKMKDAAQDPALTSFSPDAERLMTPLARANFAKLAGGQFAPHNRIGAVNEEDLAAAFPPVPRDRDRNEVVIVGCMKNEGPYILEWIAYHRAIGVDNFIIYTNGCEDGTDEVLGRLQDLGIAQLRDNENWKGNSPQQHALNQSLKEPLIRNAKWIAHIDVDEFINIRCGNGTLQDVFTRVPDATNIAMTWRMFGHNGVQRFEDRLVIDQFDTCAPKYCPKPHTVWGFKTLFQNIGAYEKISCHRPTKLQDKRRDAVRWVNGSGQPMGDAVKDNGWRSSVKSVGYDLIQLNHYALRSAESFLIKRQRGRALHVDRSIGINYWVRMDWGDYRDITIKRNIPRVRAELDRLMADPALAKAHQNAVAWHRAKADALHRTPEFADLYKQALTTRLTEMERVAYALALDMES